MGTSISDALSAGPQDCAIRYINNSKTISGRLHDEMVMMDIELGKYFSLNPVATRIWDLLVQPLSLEELCRLLTEEYEVEVEQCRDETSAYLREMVNMGLVLELK